MKSARFMPCQGGSPSRSFGFDDGALQLDKSVQLTF
jgi:hypothetical protein